MGDATAPDVPAAALTTPDDGTDRAYVGDDGEAGSERASETVFPQSVASGGPTPSGVVLWTRLDPERFDPDEQVRLVVARDRAFEEVVLDGCVPDGHDWAVHDHTVRVDTDGHLDPDATFYYRFVHDGVASRVGRCRTLPDPDASPESVRFAVLTCQDYENGYYGALSHVADEDVDFVVHLGDVVYESAANLYGAGEDPVAGRDLSLPSGHDVAWTGEDLRHLHRTYRSDPHLQAMHEAHTVIVTWDDHAIADDRYWDDETDAPAFPDHPRGDDPEFTTRLTSAGIAAWYDYVPVRAEYDPDADHPHDQFRLYRTVEFGDLLDLVVTDQRFYRDRAPTNTVTLAGATFGLGVDDDPDRSMLGREQFEWLGRELRQAESRWLCWASPVLSIPFRFGLGPLSVRPKIGATWDGYAVERKRIYEELGAADPSVVTFSGDLHSYVVGTQRLGGTSGEAVGTEFMTPAITSVTIAEGAGLASGLATRLTRPLFRQVFTAMNPQMSFFDSHDWGYSVVEFTREDCSYTAYAVDKLTDSADAERRELVRFRRSHEDPAVERLSRE
ncbi:alkaline phosphatase D family protein [Halomarina salina]|uniref:Alkaline phosphatase D family protein n=1 Tax=Halomarina salina TaxID=1872699 RepID=A0ABD5RRM7_9EURY|nr:alkaline phosphatase D family protein [Halomarina salina]